MAAPRVVLRASRAWRPCAGGRRASCAGCRRRTPGYGSPQLRLTAASAPGGYAWRSDCAEEIRKLCF
ncbi:hypothetical protein GUJ93_ZPchr0013g33987 [Zizania palustris]|uniref:Uncharacterized protein n=1 Tax=Zizania palustris TaxID=103762 RepID=A0A8J6C0X0_ZIZPA|nr:hypothetical protein GUJ93_ZPchr0013g33987 [Zizania palustris]